MALGAREPTAAHAGDRRRRGEVLGTGSATAAWLRWHAVAGGARLRWREVAGDAEELRQRWLGLGHGGVRG